MTNLISEPSKSPYIVGEPVSGSDFFDREEILNLIKDFVLSDKRYIFLIHGQRRIGKTSLLRKIFEKANREWGANPVFFNLQGHAEDSINDLIVEIAKAINDSFPIRKQLLKKHISPVSGFYKTFIPKIIQELKSKKLILLFDEFDTLGPSEFITDPAHRKMAFHAFIPFIEQMLEYLQQQKIAVKFIIACGRNYKDLDNDRYGHLFRFARQSEITIFTRLQFDSLIKTAQIHIPFQPDAVNLIFKITGGHPMFTQCLCDAAFRFAEKNNLLEITSEIVQDVTELVIRQNSSAVLWIWSSLPDKAKIVLYIAAHLPANQNSFSKNSLINQARKYNLLPVTEDLDATLDILICNRFLKYDGEDGNYLFEIEFLHKWILLEINRNSIYKLISVLDEDTELLKANARYSYKKEDWQVCIKYNKEIIKRFQDNYEALSQLMVCFSKINDTDNSFKYYEKASKIDPLVTNDLLTEYELSFSEKIINSTLTKHLPLKRPEYSLGENVILQFRYQYPFFPDGLMGRLIYQLHDLIFEGKAWLFGAIFAENNCIAEVLQQETTNEGLKYISIKIAGKNAGERRAFLRTIREQIEYMHENTYPNIECNAMVECNCTVCGLSETPNFYELIYLKSNIEAGEKTIFCKIGKQRVTIDKILNEIYG